MRPRTWAAVLAAVLLLALHASFAAAYIPPPEGTVGQGRDDGATVGGPGDRGVEDPSRHERAASPYGPVQRKEGRSAGLAPAIIVEEWRYEFDLEPSWHLQFGSSPAVGDADVDFVTSPGEVPEDLEIMSGTDMPTDAPNCLGKWQLLDSRGALEWELCTQSDEPGSSPFFSDIDGDCEYEMGGGATSGANFEVIDHTGQFEWYWPTTLHDAYFWDEYWAPTGAVADLLPEEEGREIVATRYDGYIRMFRGTDGLLLWEQMIATGDPLCWGVECELYINSSPAVGDLDGDGDLDIVVGTNNGVIDSRDRDGNERWRFTVGGRVMASPSLGDFDGDGDLEIVVGSDDNMIYFIDGDENGNGVIDADEYTTYATTNIVRSSAAIGDVDGDGDMEVIVGSYDQHVYSLDYDPAGPTVVLNWSKTLGGAVVSSPSLADRQGTGELDVYVGCSDQSLYLLDGATGAAIEQVPLGKNIPTSPTVADVDGDGRLEILVMTLDVYDTLYCLEDTESNVEPRTVEWGKFRHDDRNTGRYGVPYPRLDDPCYNSPPTCDAGDLYEEECQGAETQVTLDGSGSEDPDGDPLTYTWEGPFAESPATGEIVTATFTGTGSFDVTLTVDDGTAPPVTCGAVVIIEDTLPPVILDVTGVEPGECYFEAPPVDVEVTDQCTPNDVEVVVEYVDLDDDPSMPDCDLWRVDVTATDAAGNSAYWSAEFIINPDDCDDDGIPDCRLCDLNYDAACFYVNRLCAHCLAGSDEDSDEGSDDEWTDEWGDEGQDLCAFLDDEDDDDPVEEIDCTASIIIEGSFQFASCPEGSSPPGSLSPEDGIRITLGGQVEHNAPPTGGTVIFDRPFADFTEVDPGVFRYASVNPLTDVVLDFPAGLFSLRMRPVDVYVDDPDLAVILEAGRHRAFEIVTVALVADGFGYEREPPEYCVELVSDEDEDGDESADSDEGGDSVILGPRRDRMTRGKSGRSRR